MIQRIACSVSALIFSMYAGTVFAQPANSVKEGPTVSGIGFKTVADALANVTTQTGAAINATNPEAWTIVTESDGMTIWSFTPSTYDAYPAVVKRVLKTSPKGFVYVEMSVLCEAKKPACDKLEKSFEDQNQRMVKQIQERSKTSPAQK